MLTCAKTAPKNDVKSTYRRIFDFFLVCVCFVFWQAQACFYEKAVKDRAKTKLKATIIAKLAAKAGEVCCSETYSRFFCSLFCALLHFLFCPSTCSPSPCTLWFTCTHGLFCCWGLKFYEHPRSHRRFHPINSLSPSSLWYTCMHGCSLHRATLIVLRIVPEGVSRRFDPHYIYFGLKYDRLQSGYLPTDCIMFA